MAKYQIKLEKMGIGLKILKKQKSFKRLYSRNNQNHQTDNHKTEETKLIQLKKYSITYNILLMHNAGDDFPIPEPEARMS